MRTRVKICGITRPADAVLAAALGADAIGLVFVARSPRAVEPPRAAEILGALPAFVSRVGLFVDPETAQVRALLDTLALDFLQFHGDESPEFCRAFGRPYVKALRVRSAEQVAAGMARYPDAAGLLLDAWNPAAHGGTGERFDWDLIPDDRPLPLILAGGLTPGNVAEAVRTVRPFAVDVSSGVEAAPGSKDADKLRNFFTQVVTADAESRATH